jgi:hypothetical protein
MGRSNRLLEREINTLIAEEMREAGFLVLTELRLHPSEMDIVLFDPKTLKLANLEIKRANWRAVLSQAIRATLYCHFAVAVLPVSLQGVAPVEEFVKRGIGLIFYDESETGITLTLMCRPSISGAINRPLKQLVYRQFYARFGELVYA